MSHPRHESRKIGAVELWRLVPVPMLLYGPTASSRCRQQTTAGAIGDPRYRARRAPLRHTLALAGRLLVVGRCSRVLRPNIICAGKKNPDTLTAYFSMPGGSGVGLLGPLRSSPSNACMSFTATSVRPFDCGELVTGLKSCLSAKRLDGVLVLSLLLQRPFAVGYFWCIE